MSRQAPPWLQGPRRPGSSSARCRAAASGGGLTPGARADLLVIDEQSPGVLGVPASHTLDALVFGTDAPGFQEVWVGGRRVIASGRHGDAGAIAKRFVQAMGRLWTGVA